LAPFGPVKLVTAHELAYVTVVARFAFPPGVNTPGSEYAVSLAGVVVIESPPSSIADTMTPVVSYRKHCTPPTELFQYTFPRYTISVP
jgi:hypothetical protein